MGQIIVTERIYVDARGRRVAESSSKVDRLAAVPGDTLSEAQAAALGMKEFKAAEDKSRAPEGDKGSRIWPIGGKKE